MHKIRGNYFNNMVTKGLVHLQINERVNREHCEISKQDREKKQLSLVSCGKTSQTPRGESKTERH